MPHRQSFLPDRWHSVTGDPSINCCFGSFHYGESPLLFHSASTEPTGHSRLYVLQKRKERCLSLTAAALYCNQVTFLQIQKTFLSSMQMGHLQIQVQTTWRARWFKPSHAAPSLSSLSLSCDVGYQATQSSFSHLLGNFNGKWKEHSGWTLLLEQRDGNGDHNFHSLPLCSLIGQEKSNSRGSSPFLGASFSASSSSTHSKT